ncbi:MAG: hypothetical protein JXO72_00885 [Vicinamibacteria bacterium]|nr:hypothetical protein [Vicinamibacteria bacterium]
MKHWSRRDVFAVGLFFVLPLLAHAPAWLNGRLLGPGDGAALHYPLRAAVWQSFRQGEVPAWNPWIFSGTPLLASYRPGALHPLMLILAPLAPFAAFQILVLLSLSLSGAFLYVFVRRLGAEPVGGFVSGLCFALGPYLVGHLGDTATIVAVPWLVLLMLSAELYMERHSGERGLLLALCAAMTILAGSPEATLAAAALVTGRIVFGHFLQSRDRTVSLGRRLLPLSLGVLLAAPQIIPTLLAVPEAGRQVVGLAVTDKAPVSGAAGLILRYVSHTPAPALAIAALPLILVQIPARVLGMALILCLILQWGRGPLLAPGPWALIFDLALAIFAGLSLSEQWRQRRSAKGVRLRQYFLLTTLALTTLLPLSVAVIGPLSPDLSGSVGVLALALILYFTLASSERFIIARVWLLPLTFSFLLQPLGRHAWHGAPSRHDIETGTPSREAVDRVLGRGSHNRTLTLVREWPHELFGLAFGNLGLLTGRRSANGYDPMVPLRNRQALGGMNVAGLLLSREFLRSDPAFLEIWGINWAQVPTSALAVPGSGPGEALDMTIEPDRPRVFGVPIVAANEIRIVSSLSNSVDIEQNEVVARIQALLATGRHVDLVLRAGKDTSEWAYDRADVRNRVRHARATVHESWPGLGGGFEGHRYVSNVRLPGRYFLNAVRFEAAPGSARLFISRLTLLDTRGGASTGISSVSGYLSDTSVLDERVTTPDLRLYRIPGSRGQAYVVTGLKALPADENVRRGLLFPRTLGVNLRREALANESDVRHVTVPRNSRASRAMIQKAEGPRIDLRAEGPGILVLAEGWGNGWSARMDGQAVALFRVNHAQIGCVLPPGMHQVSLLYHVHGLTLGCAIATLSLIGLLWIYFRAWRRHDSEVGI